MSLHMAPRMIWGAASNVDSSLDQGGRAEDCRGPFIGLRLRWSLAIGPLGVGAIGAGIAHIVGGIVLIIVLHVGVFHTPFVRKEMAGTQGGNPAWAFRYDLSTTAVNCSRRTSCV